MKIGLQIPEFNTPDGPPRLGADLATVARTADEGGFEFIALMDHFFQIGMVGPPDQAMLEAYTTLGYLAACTSRAKLLTLVTGAVYRHPGVLAKIVTTLDVLSGGVPGSASAPRGMRRSRAGSASRSRPSPSGSSGSRRPCRSACRCGAATRAHTGASTTSSSGR